MVDLDGVGLADPRYNSSVVPEDVLISYNIPADVGITLQNVEPKHGIDDLYEDVVDDALVGIGGTMHGVEHKDDKVIQPKKIVFDFTVDFNAGMNPSQSKDEAQTIYKKNSDDLDGIVTPVEAKHDIVFASNSLVKGSIFYPLPTAHEILTDEAKAASALHEIVIDSSDVKKVDSYGMESSGLLDACVHILGKCKHGCWYEKIYACVAVPFVCTPAAFSDGIRVIHDVTTKNDALLLQNDSGEDAN